MFSVLRAYIDEFDDYQNEKCVCFGMQGLVGTVSAWHRLQCRWEDALECCRVKYFHATDLQASEGEFRGWTRYQRERLVSMLLNSLCDIQGEFWLLGAGIMMSSWRLLPEYRRRFVRNPYFLSAFSLMHDATRFSHFDFGGKPIEFVFDQKLKHQHWIDDAYSEAQKGKYGHLCAAKSMASHKLVPPVQIADFIAYEAEKYIHRRIARASDQELTEEDLRYPLKQLRPLFMASDTTLYNWHGLMLTTDFWGNYKRLCRHVLRIKVEESYGERFKRIRAVRQNYEAADWRSS